ncbi:MAG: TOBE domain-containing protein, partial [Solobacterium sp.]|nr:TOBE domain-containing protein [Solobacterium sp.]
DEAKEGSKALCAIRPDEFRIHTDGTEGIPAKIKSSVFLGTAMHYFLELNNGEEIEAVQDAEVWEILPDGKDVTLTIKTSKVNLFDENGDRPLIIREEDR